MRCHYTEFRYVECRVLFIALLNVVKLSAVMLNVVKLSAVMLNVVKLSIIMLRIVMLSIAVHDSNRYLC
jgi:hypothetical protein